MKKIACVIIGICLVNIVLGQEMPSVFNKSLSGSDNKLKKVLTQADGSLIVIGGGALRSYLAKLSPDGTVLFEKKNNKEEAFFYNDAVLTSDSLLVVVGGGTKYRGAGRISLFNSKNILVFDKVFGNNSGGYFNKVKQDNAGNFIAVGLDGSSPSKSRITKFNKNGTILFDKILREGTVFNDFIIEENDSFIAIGGDVGNLKGQGLIVKLSPSGEKVYEINSGNGGFNYTKAVLTSDGSLLAIGGGSYGSGNPCRATKINRDGQVVFDKTYSLVDGRFTAMDIDYQDQVTLSAEEFDRGRIVKLRSDGTTLFNIETHMPIVDLAVTSSDQIIAIGAKNDSSKVIKMKDDGQIIFDVNYPEKDSKNLGVNLKKLLLSEDGKIYTLANKGYRILKFNDLNGSLIFDKDYGKSSIDGSFEVIENLPSGEIIAAGGGKGDGNRVIKLSHGASINDLTVKEPLNGSIMARVTVSLTGFLLENGIRKPVSIAYKSLLNNYIDDGDVTPIEGVLSFIPSDFSQGEPIVKMVELPIHSNQALKGTEKVSIALSNAVNTYIAKPTGIITIEEPEAVIRFISGSDALEGKPLGYTVGLFKQDGTVLKNKTGAPINIIYKFGFGSAVPNREFKASTTLPLVINDGDATGSLSIPTYEDSFYNNTKSVQLVLLKVYSSKNTVIEFLGKAKTLSQNQYINDIGAEIKITKISDQSQKIGGEFPVGMFKISLVKASDGSVVTNCSGGDIRVDFSIDPNSTASINQDFVITNGNSVSIAGGCNGREADVKIMCIPNSKANTNKSIMMNLVRVAGPSSAGPLTISSNKQATALLKAH